MIDVRTAYEIAKKNTEGYELAEVREANNSWIFCFVKRMDNGMILPQSPNILVNKESGECRRLVIPPIENLAILYATNIIEFAE